MRIPHASHIKFYEWQIQVLEEEWQRYANTKMKILIQENRLFVGRIWGIQESQGNVVLRFKSDSVPRMKQPFILCMVGTDVPANSSEWDFSYLTFRMSQSPRLSSVNTEIRTITYLKSEEVNWSYILISGFEDALISSIQEKYLNNGQHPLIVAAETDPPIDYLINLKEYVRRNEKDEILNLNADTNEDNWRPKNLDNEKEITKHVIKLIEEQPTTIIQGPPGTGKSYLAAELCEYFLKKGKSICVTALTNRALIEIASQVGLTEPINKGKVFKTNLSSDELKDLSGLKRVESFSPAQGDLLLSTYYKLSQKQAEIIEESKRFDLLIVEEASQAYLATIAMFSSIALKVLIIGDHKQLTPVVIKRDVAKKIHPNIDGIINGLQTFTFNNNHISYRLTKTRRLTSDAARLTGMYYNNTLKSISDIEGEANFSSVYRNLFHQNGGVSIAKLSSAMTGFSERDVLKFICIMAREILTNNKKLEVALLTPYVNVESGLYSQYSKLSNDYTRITINTVHKIQGLTTDITILFLPLNNPALDLDDNLFNVATSRAKMGTLILSYQHIDLVRSVSKETLQFIHSCKNVSANFKEIFNKEKD